MTDKEIKIINDSITRMLARREHSCVEISRKLHAKGLSPELCARQIALFRQQGLQSDSRFAESLVRSKVSKGQGEQRIRAELREHDIDDQVGREAIAAQEVDWYQLARQTLEKKFGQGNADDWQAQQKRARFLQYRGFSQEQIRYAIDCAESGE